MSEETRRESPGPAAEERPGPVAEDLVREVRIGGEIGETIVVSRFFGLKATRLMREVAAIARAYPEITKIADAFEADFVERNAVELDRSEAELLFPDEAPGISEEAWQHSGQKLRRRRMPKPTARFAAVLPEILELVETRGRVLLAVIATSNAKLEEEDQGEKGLDAYLEQRGRELFARAPIEDLLELLIAGWDVGRAQFAPLEAIAGKAPILRLLLARFLPAAAAAIEPTEDPEEAASPTSPPSSETPPASSSDSEPPSDGPDPTPSIASPGSSFVGSATD